MAGRPPNDDRGRPLPIELDLAEGDEVESFSVDAPEDPEDGPDEPDAPRVSGFDGIGTRREARERAVSLLYEAEQRGLEPLAEVLVDLPVRPDEFAVRLVEGVSGNQDRIDTMIRTYSRSWPLERMPAIDRALLRLGIYELVESDVPTGAVISEAVELAKRYSTEDSHKFVNGMLARVAEEARGDRTP